MATLKQIISYLLGFLLLTSGAMAQQQEPPMMTIKGKLVDYKTRKSLPYGTVFLKSEPEMVLVKGVAADEDGNFILRVPKATYWMVVSYVGYSTTMFCVTEDKSYGELAMKEAANMLDPVTAKPLVETSVDKIVYNITSDPERDKLSVSEILKKVPMIRELPNGNIYIDSPDKKFLVVRNGKVDALFSGNVQDVLKDLPAKGFATVRLLLAPPERYGEYDYILDIVTDETTRLIGAVGSTKGSYHTAANNVQLTPEVTFSGGKLRGVIAVNGGLAEPAKQHSTMEQYYFESAQQTSRKEVVSQSSKNGSIKGAFSYDIHKNHFLSLQADYQSGEFETHQTQASVTAIGEQLIRQYNARMDERRVASGLKTSLDYEMTFAKPDRILNFSWLYSGKPSTTKHHVISTEKLSAERQQQRDRSQNDSYEHVVQLNYTDPLTDRWNIEAGVKYTRRNYRIENEFDRQISDMWQPEAELYSLLDRNYNIITGYGKLSYTQKKLSLAALVNGEYLEDGKGTKTVSGDRQEFIQEEGAVFSPKFELDYQGKLVRVDLSYSYNTSRPGLKFLNPMVIDPNADVITVGNPDLSPERRHQYRLFLYFRTKISQDVGFIVSHSNNMILPYWYENEQGKSVRSFRNAGASRSVVIRYGLDYRPSTSLYIRVHPLYIYSYREWDKNETQQAHEFNLQMTINYNWKGWSLGIMPVYYYQTTNGQEGAFVRPFILGVSVDKKFLKNKLEVGVGLDNLFQRNTETTTEVTTPDFRMKTKTTSGCYAASLTLRYRFGSFQVKPVRQAKSRAAITDIKTEE